MVWTLSYNDTNNRRNKDRIGDKATVLKVNVDDNRDVSVKYGIRSIPTIILFKNGEPIWRQTGVVQSKVLVDKINYLDK